MKSFCCCFLLFSEIVDSFFYLKRYSIFRQLVVIDNFNVKYHVAYFLKVRGCQMIRLAQDDTNTQKFASHFKPSIMSQTLQYIL